MKARLVASGQSSFHQSTEHAQARKDYGVRVVKKPLGKSSRKPASKG